MEKYAIDPDYALAQDCIDVLQSFRQQFFIPKQKNGKDTHYFAGNSLGAQPKDAAKYVAQEMEKWQQLGVAGHHHNDHPWLSYQKILADQAAPLLGGEASEVVFMNSLTVNLHLMLVSFYRPTALRYKILINANIFPSDFYALCSEVKFHGLDPSKAIIVLPSSAEGIVDPEEIDVVLHKEGESIALVMMEGVNYFSGQAFDIPHITKKAQQQGCLVGFDLAHTIGNCELTLHDAEVDFAVWCSYKYLNGGPGAIGGCFIHQKHHKADLHRFAGWWGHELQSRFSRNANFKPIPCAEGWQLSNPPIISLACLRASLDIFERAGLKRLREKSIRLTGYLEFLIEQLGYSNLAIITPHHMAKRGCQLSLLVKQNAKLLLEHLNYAGFVCDLRAPNCIRIAPVPLYNTFSDVYELYKFLKQEAIK